MVVVRSSQKLFSEEEVSRLTGICLDHLHNLALSKHLGFIDRAGEQAGKWFFTSSDLMILNVLFTRCHH